VVSHKVPTRLGDNIGFLNARFFRKFLTGVYDIVGVFLNVIIDARIRRAVAPVVVDSESPSDIQASQWNSHLFKFHIESEGLLQSLLEFSNVGDL